MLLLFKGFQFKKKKRVQKKVQKPALTACSSFVVQFSAPYCNQIMTCLKLKKKRNKILGLYIYLLIKSLFSFY